MRRLQAHRLAMHQTESQSLLFMELSMTHTDLGAEDATGRSTLGENRLAQIHPYRRNSGLG